ncbi:hypothetical protein ACIA5D_45140 [Actinoplanes sp. NPDC051513]|uniref:hypothetical protein n=1 Tax=Actinoplanes sp. NPDC051513 TaxID=3363908 RepID=UPI0037A3D72F
MRSRIFSTLAALAAGVALTAGTVGVVGAALGGGSDNSATTTHEAAKIMSVVAARSNPSNGN